MANVGQALRDAAGVLAAGRRAQIVHLNLAAAPSLPLLRALFLAGAARVGGARVILHAHTGRLDRSARSRTYRGLMRLVGRLVDRLVVVSVAAERTVRELVPDVVRIENGVDPSIFSTGPKDDAPPTVVFVGTVSERKGLMDLRDALLALQGDGVRPHTVIVGDSRQEGPGVFQRIRRAYRAAGLDAVEFAGSLPHDEVLDRLARAGIFCLPSHWEGFPLALLEAMASGCAIIATRVGDMPAMVDQGRAGILVERGDVPALASAIRRLLEDPTERERLAVEARRLVEQRYSRHRMMAAVVRLYEELAATRCSRAPGGTPRSGPPPRG